MPPIDPRVVKAKRFPVHAAVHRCNGDQIVKLLEEDAPFHIGRKIPDVELSVLHVGCMSRHGPSGVDDKRHVQLFVEIVKYLINMGAGLEDVDSIGQTALLYAVCHQFAQELVTVLIDRGANPLHHRSSDGWTPLHLAAMFGKVDVIQILMEAGADPYARDHENNDVIDIARHFKHYQIADMLQSPRRAHRPKTVPNQFTSMFGHDKRSNSDVSPPFQELRDKHISWSDEDGNTLLHLAAWHGDLNLVRSFFENIRGRKLVTATNKRNATPLALAIINGQVRVVEEFFMNKHAKKLIDLSAKISPTGHTICHLLLQFAPFIHPKFLLKRKDFTRELLNALDNEGNSAMMYLASKNSKPTLRKIFANKNVKDGRMLDLSVRERNTGKSLLHFFAANKDDESMAAILDRDELTAEVANIKDRDGRTPLIICLQEGSPYMVRDILEHPTAKDKFSLIECMTQDGRSLLHLVAEQNNASLWRSVASRPDCDPSVADRAGNTPYMHAVIHKKVKLLTFWLKDKKEAARIDLRLKNREGKNLLMLFVDHLDLNMLRLLLKSVDVRPSVDDENEDGMTVLLTAVSAANWKLAEELLSNPNLKRPIPEEPTEMEGCIDVHPMGVSGLSALAQLIVTRIRLERKEQTHKMKKQSVFASETRKEIDQVSGLVKLILQREREIHGTSMNAGRDGGTICIKGQMCRSKLIQIQMMDEIVNEYTKLFAFVKLKKRPSTNGTSGQDKATNGVAPPKARPVNSVVKEVQEQMESAKIDPLKMIAEAEKQLQIAKEKENAKSADANADKLTLNGSKVGNPPKDAIKKQSDSTKTTLSGTSTNGLNKSPSDINKEPATQVKAVPKTTSKNQSNGAPLVIKTSAKDEYRNNRISEEMAEIEEVLQQAENNVQIANKKSEPVPVTSNKPSTPTKIDPLKMILEAEKQLQRAKEKASIDQPTAVPIEKKGPSDKGSDSLTNHINSIARKEEEVKPPARKLKQPEPVNTDVVKPERKLGNANKIDDMPANHAMENGKQTDTKKETKDIANEKPHQSATEEPVVLRRTRGIQDEGKKGEQAHSNPFRRSRLLENADDPEPNRRRSRFLSSQDSQEDNVADKRKSWRDGFDSKDVEKPSTRAFDKINLSGVRTGYKFDETSKKPTESPSSKPPKTDPESKLSGSNKDDYRNNRISEEMAEIQAQMQQAEESKAPAAGKKSDSASTSKMDPSLGLPVNVRPGYKDVSTQTNLMPAKAKCNCRCSCGQ